MRKRTDMDWSKHIVEAETVGDFATIHRLRIPDSICLMVEFINMHDRGLLVRGDFGSWIFSQCFYPSRDGEVLEQYWLEKLLIANNRQDVHDFSRGVLDAEIEDLVEFSKEAGRYNQTKDFIESLRLCASKEEVVSSWDYAPNWVDPEDYPEGLDICERLKIIFDAFDEICRRMKPCERQKQCKSKKVGELGVCIFYREQNATCRHTDYERILGWGNN